MLAPVRVIAPTELPVSLETMKAHLSVDHTDHDALIDGYIASAVSHIEGQYGLALVTQTLAWETDCFGGLRGIELPRRPVQEVVSVEYYAPNETTLTTLAESAYLHVGHRIKLAAGASWPSVYSRDDAVTVTFTAGFGDAADIAANQAAIPHAIMMMVGHWYANRETVVLGAAAVEMPMAAKDLLHAYWRPSL